MILPFFPFILENCYTLHRSVPGMTSEERGYATLVSGVPGTGPRDLAIKGHIDSPVTAEAHWQLHGHEATSTNGE